VDPMVSGSSAAYIALQVLWTEVRHVLAILVWGLVAGLAGAAGCWCCGYAARAAWLTTGPPGRRPSVRRRGDATANADAGADGVELVDLTVHEEAERGIRELEAYLEAVRAARPELRPESRPDPPSDRDREPDAGT